MSDGMEQENDEQMIEREKMKKQLEDMGIYEESDTFDQMKKLLGFLNNSETTPSVATDNKHMQKKDNECLLELTSETDASQEQQAVVVAGAQESPEVAYKPSRTSPMTAQQERKSSRHSGSSESLSPPIFDVRGPAQRRKSAENDETTSSEKQQQQHEQSESGGVSRSVPSKSGNGTQECQNSPTDAKTTMQCAMQSTYHQRLERWRMNPLDVYINENDVPLQQPSSRLIARKCASSSCHNKTYTSEQHDQKRQALSQHLREMADLWYSWQRPVNAKFEWGVPIEVGTANGSLDRKPTITEPKTEPIKAEYAYRDSYERSSKRKANSLIAKECASLNKESSSDENDEYDFARVKKKKMIQSDDKSSSTVNRVNQRIPRHEEATLIARQQRSHNNDNDSDVCTDDEDVRSPRRRKIENEENERVSPVLIVQLKRMVPSTPKARPNLSRLRRGRLSLKRTDGNGEMERTRSQKKDNVMTDEEIRRKLEDDSDGEEVATILRKDTETRSSKETRSRLQERRLSNNAETLRETSATSRERESDRQRGSKEKKADLGEQRRKENKCEIENKEVNWERQLLDDDDDEINQPAPKNGNWREKSEKAESTKNISCPICYKPFPSNEIENHAAYCENNDEEDDNDADLYKCKICDNYETRNGSDYQEHVKRCIESKKDKKNLHDDVDIVPISSSHRPYKLNEQKAASSSSEIDLMEQSPSHSRTRVFTNRKRKH